MSTHRQECCGLSTFSCARVAHHHNSHPAAHSNPPTRKTFKNPIPIFSPHFLESLQSFTTPFTSSSLNLHQCVRVAGPSDAGRWPLLSHMRLLQLPLSSTCHPATLPLCHPTQPATLRVLFYSTLLPAKIQNIQNIRYKKCQYPTQPNVTLAQHPPLYFTNSNLAG